ncbi:hypothetical protein [Polaromonas sp. P5_D5]
MKRHLLVTAVLASVLSTQGCAWRSYSNDVYTDADTQKAHSIVMATVTDVRVVTIERGVSGAGAAAGGSVGAALGSTNTNRNGQLAASVLGGVAGGFAGQAVEAHMSKAKGLEISLRLDDGQRISVVQAGDEVFQKGDRVQVRTAEGKSRVTR